MNKISSSDRAALIKLASSLPAGDETRRAILAGLAGTGKTAATKAVEPYQKVEGLPYGRGQKKNLFPKVTNERQLRELSKLLDKGFEAFEGGKSITKANQALADKLSALGVDTKSLWGGYDLWVTDAEGVEYDAHNDLGIG